MTDNMSHTAVSADALKATKTLFLELGYVESIADDLDLDASVRDEYGLDSQELVELAEAASSLCVGVTAELTEHQINTPRDVVTFLQENINDWLPGDTQYCLQGSVVIRQSREKCFDYINNYRAWPHLLAHVTRIEDEYDDGIFQSFRMHIRELNGGHEYFVKSMRYADAKAKVIAFTQPLPPKGFAVHKGGWRFRKVAPKTTELISYHAFSLNGEMPDAEAITLIRKHIQAALRTWSQVGNK